MTVNQPNPDAVYICPGDPYCPPRGGQTAFAIQALNAFGSRFALVAPDESDRLPVGSWVLSEWHDRPIWRFNIGSYAPRNKSHKPLTPRRIVFRRLIAKYLPAIREIPTRNLFCDSPELLRVLRRYEWSSFCYRFAGLNNPVAFSRYSHLRFLAKWFHRRMMNNLVRLKPAALLASADRLAIDKFEKENRELLDGCRLLFFPTRFNEDIFHPGDFLAQRLSLGLTENNPILVSVGRLCWVKGWRLVLETLVELKKKYPSVKLIFVGDGEDRASLEEYARKLGVSGNVRVEGFLSPMETWRRLVAADLYLCSSYCEGWSVAMTEALGCGKICVSTNVSGVENMIHDGLNGRIITERDPVVYAQAIDEALFLRESSNKSEHYSLELAQSYSTSKLAEEWGKHWYPLETRILS